MSKTHGGHTDAPQDHDGRDENARSKALQQNVGQRLRERVADEEKTEGGIILAWRYMKCFFEADQSRVADVGPIEE